MINNLEEILNLADEEVALLLSLLKKAIKTFPNTYVSIALLKRGFISHKGLIVRVQDIEHRFILDYYEKTFLETLTSLLKKLWEEKESQTNIFSFRVLLEMSVEDSFIIFNKNVDKDDKRLFLLITLLVDYASINTPLSSQFYGWFEKMFSSNQKLLQSSLSEQMTRTP